jgi:hypothetical protein
MQLVAYANESYEKYCSFIDKKLIRKSTYIYFYLHNFCRDIVYVNYTVHVSAFRPSSGGCVHCWLHCSPLIFFSVYSGYI